MEFILFFYTLIIMLFAALAAATCLSGFLVSHRKSFAYGMVMFVAYFFDVSIVFYHDFVVHNESLDPAAFYDINSPVMFIICGAAVFGSLWLYFCEKAGMYNPVGEILPTVMFVAMSAAVLIFVTEPHLRIFLFFINRSVFLAVIFCILFLQLFFDECKKSASSAPKTHICASSDTYYHWHCKRERHFPTVHEPLRFREINCAVLVFCRAQHC